MILGAGSHGYSLADAIAANGAQVPGFFYDVQPMGSAQKPPNFSHDRIGSGQQLASSPAVVLQHPSRRVELLSSLALPAAR